MVVFSYLLQAKTGGIFVQGDLIFNRIKALDRITENEPIFALHGNNETPVLPFKL